MTLEEKKCRVQSYCSNTDCYKCLLRVGDWKNEDAELCCLNIECSPESDLDIALGIIEGRIDVADAEEDEITVELKASDPMNLTIDDIATLISKCEDKGVGCRIEFIPIKKKSDNNV